MKRVYLVGFMGSGKSAIGKRLGTLLNLPFYDMDTEIANRTGMAIPQIFETYGEEGFREMETEFLRNFHDEYCIIATGGGVAMREENREIMRRTGLVFYLNSTFRDIWRRISTDRNRPIVQQSSRYELEKLFHNRKPLYMQSAHFKVETTNRTLKEITQYIASQIIRLKNG
ncbi:shikimate kinase [Sporosarcina sp. 179-K 8C2 HS]|uniref:shikimate kinase n=1 Tax=Sporosarcina sp. 179-K 8C2 HS TaxID=3142387 RepID=UPI0039A0EC6C